METLLTMKNAMSMQAKELKQLKIQLAMTTKLFEKSKPTARPLRR
jgi:hypothetical protein